MASPQTSRWATTTTTSAAPATALVDIMAQQFVQAEEEEDQTVESDEALALRLQTQFDLEASDAAPDNSDFRLAMRLQAQFDQAHNEQLNARQQRLNGNSKVSVSFEKHLRPMAFYVDFLTDEVDMDDAEPQPAPVAPPPPTAGKKEIITKHDIPTNNRRNARRLETLPLSFNSGSTADDPAMQIPNKVFNSIREYSRKPDHTNSRNKLRLHGKEDVSTNDRVLDYRTRRMLFSMMSSGVLPELLGVISSGKEANVYAGVFSPQALDMKWQSKTRAHAEPAEVPDQDADDDEIDGEEDEECIDCAIKIFRTSLNEFKQREIYVRDDFRFSNRISRSNPRKFITLWAEKEKDNLYRMQRAGVRSPRVLLYEKHILVMQLLGKRGRPAPKLHEAAPRLSAAKMTALYRDCLRMMRAMYYEASLVHADLSSYNVLYHNGKLWFIDVSQAVIRSHPHAHEFLLRDCRNMATFFATHGVADVLTPLEMVAYVTFHAGRFARSDADDGAVVMEDDGDEELSDTDSASLAGSTDDGTRRRSPRRSADVLDFAQEDAFLEQIKKDVAALVAAHPNGVDPVANAAEMLPYLLPTLSHQLAEDAYPGPHLATAAYRLPNDQDEDEDEDDESPDEDDAPAFDPAVAAHLDAALQRAASQAGRSTTTPRSARRQQHRR